MQQRLPRRRRPRPLPDAPIDRLLIRSSELAGGWLVALVEELPLQETPRIHLTALAAAGPALCEAMVRAVADDAGLRELDTGGAGERLAARAGQIAGASAPETISGAVDCLLAVIRAAMREEWVDPAPDQLFDLGERLALVGELVRGAALRAWSAPDELTAARRESPPPEEGDELGWEVRLSDWIARAHERSSALALLMVELDDIDRLLAISSPEEVAAALESFETTVRSVQDRGEILVEGGRAWLIVPGLSRARAWGLGAKLSSAVSAAYRWRGAPLSVSVGLAVLGQNGDDAASMIAAAEESRFAAQATGSSPSG
jgi:GGDEF domain-containing protein